MNPQFKFCFLIGFDRCGSSMLSRVLAQHPGVNLLFQPFNSTEVSRTQWQRWKEGDNHSATQHFIKQLHEGKINHTYIRSEWFKNYSSSQKVKRNLNLIKDTKFHFKLDWLKHLFPDVAVYGIWRQPEEILHSLVRNGFHQSWYGYLTPEILKEAALQYESLSTYLLLINDRLDDYEIMALGVALRTEVLLQSVKPSDWLVYEEVLQKPNVILNYFLKRFDLPGFDFSDIMDADYNVAGELSDRKTAWKDFFSPEQRQKIEIIFSHLNHRTQPKSLING